MVVAVEKIDDKIEKLIHMNIEKESKETQQKIDSWLDAPDPSVNLKSACDKREMGTCSWLIENSEFRSWEAASGSFLGLYGIRRFPLL